MEKCPTCGRAYPKPKVSKARFHISMLSVARLEWSIAVLWRAVERFPELQFAILEEIERLTKVIKAKKMAEAA